MDSKVSCCYKVDGCMGESATTGEKTYIFEWFKQRQFEYQVVLENSASNLGELGF